MTATSQTSPTALRSLGRQTVSLAALLYRSALATFRTGRSNGLAIAAAFLLVATFSTFASLALSGWLHEQQDVAVRTTILTVLASVVTLGWLALQHAVNVPPTLLLDIRPLRVLPFSDRFLFGSRTALSLTGAWIPVLGPGMVVLAARGTESFRSSLLAGTTLLVCVLIQGRLVSLELRANLVYGGSLK